jgi:hypothetical protein
MHVSGRNGLLCALRGRLRSDCFRSLCLVLRGVFLLDLGRDGAYVRLAELGGLAQCFAGFVGRRCCLENGQHDQQTAQGALICLAEESRVSQ